jgi:hypothetical protein
VLLPLGLHISSHGAQHGSVLLNRGTARGQHVSGNRRADAAGEAVRTVIGERGASARKANVRLGINHAEDGQRAENFIVLQHFPLAERGALDRHQHIDRNGLNAEFRECERHIQSVLPGFAHADDAA